LERREPIIEEEQPEPEPRPETAAAGGARPPGRIGSGLRDDEGGEEPPRSGSIGSHWSNPDIFNMPIEVLNLSMRAYNCLRRSGLMTVGHVIETSEVELLSLRNFGRKSYDELRERLDERGILSSRELLPVDTGGSTLPRSLHVYKHRLGFLRRLDQDPPADSR
jgi:hypothetical protein